MAEDASEYLPPRRSLTALRRAARECRGCELWREATQTVFGAGRTKAKLSLEIAACK
jgi:DNA polymerase